MDSQCKREEHRKKDSRGFTRLVWKVLHSESNAVVYGYEVKEWDFGGGSEGLGFLYTLSDLSYEVDLPISIYFTRYVRSFHS